MAGSVLKHVSRFAELYHSTRSLSVRYLCSVNS